MTKTCVDCKVSFEDNHDLYRKCENCRERDQSYKERGIREEMGGFDD